MRNITLPKAVLSTVFNEKNFIFRERKPSDYKFFCEDIEPVSLIWTKVDEAMLTTSSSGESSFDQDFEDFANDDIKTEVMKLT